ncbi:MULTISPECIES: hypothetical protein [unclassified Agarivorans]|uniref:hypothetical protein n=1 Tax=unclassified Agarivorans TaxID=2636026 RepID=UPI003D7C3928
MLNKIIFTLLLTLPFYSIAEISEEAKYASFLVQVNLTKYSEKSERCRNKMRSFTLSSTDRARLKKLPKEASKGLTKLLDDALLQCTQPEIFNLANSLLILEEQNALEKSSVIKEQVHLIRKLVFSKTSIQPNIEYSQLSPGLQSKLNKIDFLKYPFDMFVVIEGAWGLPH